MTLMMPRTAPELSSDNKFARPSRVISAAEKPVVTSALVAITAQPAQSTSSTGTAEPPAGEPVAEAWATAQDVASSDAAGTTPATELTAADDPLDATVETATSEAAGTEPATDADPSAGTVTRSLDPESVEIDTAAELEPADGPAADPHPATTASNASPPTQPLAAPRMPLTLRTAHARVGVPLAGQLR